MIDFLVKMWAAFVKELPDKLVRVILICVLLGAFGLHVYASMRIESNEDAIVEIKAHDEILEAQAKAANDNVLALAEEVRGYRSDVREQNALLRQQIERLKSGKK